MSPCPTLVLHLSSSLHPFQTAFLSFLWHNKIYVFFFFKLDFSPFTSFQNNVLVSQNPLEKTSTSLWGFFPIYNIFYSFFFLINLFVYLFLAVLGLRFYARAFSSCGKRGPLFITVRGPLTIAASLVAEHRSRRSGSVVVAHGPSCSTTCGILPDQGPNPRPLHWQADSQTTAPPGKPSIFYSLKGFRVWL